jgi:hypothetical protein
VIRTENPFKPGDLVQPREDYAALLGNLRLSRGAALVVEVSGMIVRTLQEGAILTWMAWDLEEAIREQQ